MKKSEMKELEGLTNEQRDELLTSNGYLVREGCNEDGCEEGTWWNNISYELYNEDDEVAHTICHDFLVRNNEDDEPIVLEEKWWEQVIEEN